VSDSKKNDAAQSDGEIPEAAPVDDTTSETQDDAGRADRPHDALFKWTFSSIERAKAELKSVLPPSLVKKINWDTLRLTSFGTSDKLLKHFASDLFFSADINGKPAILHVIFEHQSKVTQLMPIRVLGYWVRAIEQVVSEQGDRTPLPAVIPVVLYHGEGRWHAATSVHELFDPELVNDPDVAPHIPDFRFILDDLRFRTKRSNAAPWISSPCWCCGHFATAD
jgi:predicted transposase/invertase (TIGR01784 family)